MTQPKPVSELAVEERLAVACPAAEPDGGYLNKVIVGEVTSTMRGIPEEVRLGRREGLTRPSVVNLDNIHVIAKARLGDRLGTPAPDRERDVKRALGYALGWPELKVL